MSWYFRSADKVLLKRSQMIIFDETQFFFRKFSPLKTVLPVENIGQGSIVVG